MGNRLNVIVISIVVATALLFGGSLVQSIDLDPSAYLSSGEVTGEAGALSLDRTGHPTVVGEVYNDRGEPIDNVTVTVVFFEGEERLGSVTERALVSTLANKMRAPFSIRLSDAAGEPDSVETSVTFNESDDRPYGGLTVTDVRANRQSQDQVTVAGTVGNDGDEAIEQVRVAVTFYDERGAVIGVRSGSASPTSLAPDDTGEFRIQFNTLGHVPSNAREFADYEVTAYAD